MRLSRNMMKRRGISLLEVLISIGVTSVGLLGVLALIPLGGAQTRQGQIAERAPVIGLSAFAEIRNRDMLNPNNWLTSAGIGPTAQAIPQNFCLDPLAIASGSTAGFPQNASVQMARLTLSNGGGGVMTLPVARSIFNSQDDLRVAFPGTGTDLVDAPADRSLSPQQVWNLSKNSADASSRRQSQESMSWMTTVHPNYGDGNWGLTCDTYTVSVVVMNRRILDTTLQTEFTTVPMTDSDFPGAGVSGGDVILTFADANQAREAKTPENSWLLMSGQKEITGTNPVVYAKAFQWYRILAADQTSPTQKQVTLSGPDWDYKNLQDRQATIIPGTIAVYQRNMQLESSTLWRH